MDSVDKLIREIKKSISNEEREWYSVDAIKSSNGPSESVGYLGWANYSSQPNKGKTYQEEFEFLKDSKQFLFQTANDGLIQIYFEFISHQFPSGKKMPVCTEHKYAYFPPPSLGARAEFRIETSLKSYRLGFHSRVHFQSSGFSNQRQTCNAIPRVEIFLDNIFRFWHEDLWAKRFPEASKVLTALNNKHQQPPGSWLKFLNVNENYGHYLDEKDSINSELRQTDYGRFLSDQKSLGPLFRIDLLDIEQQSLFFNMSGN